MIRIGVAALSLLALGVAHAGPAAATPGNRAPEDKGVCLIIDNPSTPGADRLCVFSG